MAEVTFSRSLYSESAVRAAVAAYAHLCEIGVDVRNDEFRTTFPDGLEKDVIDSFANHALYETIIAPERAGKRGPA